MDAIQKSKAITRVLELLAIESNSPREGVEILINALRVISPRNGIRVEDYGI